MVRITVTCVKLYHKLVVSIKFYMFYVAKCTLGEVKLERIGLGLSPIAVRDMQGGPLGSCRASLGTCSLSYIALLLCLLIVVDQLLLSGEALRILASCFRLCRSPSRP